ncbi:FAD-binding protein [Adlercreutzia equolifaciens]|uniref:FAD-binding protein n=1 Tax=Adlercreutzia equolifaciens TaxID=446660 RepID=A0A6L8Q6V0_9ACTN|nr:FAD-binding protein [Adlercreutzia equolifaciens]MCG4825152.1 FAD-binding protein [Adlercreutzia equolifaciens]MEE0583079.1 FAD-binding protein [Adlercreutzia sp.]MZG28391.1 FAD-binding protein [Adlercreutzia equolifaciens]
MSEMNVTRRNFLSGAALVSAAIAGAGLAGCAPQSAAPAASSSSAGETLGTTGAANSTVGFDGTGTLPWLGEAPAISDDQVEEELTADVVVVGLGAAGVPAARAAAEAGAKVVCLESSSHLNSVASDMAIFGGQTQAQWGRGDGFLDKKMVVNMHMEECSHHVSQSIISRYYDESGAALDWFVGASKNLYMAPESYAEIPTDAQANYMFPYMYPVPETYDYTKEDLPCYPTSVGFSSLATVMADNLQAAVDAGAEVRYSTKGVELILNDEGAVAGIYAQAAGSDGYLKITAPSVILATGDYLGNEDMMKFYAPECVENGIDILSIDLDDEGNYTNVGEGHKMGAWAGAAIEQWHAPMIHHMGGGAGADGRGVIGNNGYLWLNLRGKRFMNEDLPGQQLENQVELQPQRKAYQFFDASWPEQLAYFPAAHGVACIYRDEPLPEYTASGLRINVRTPADIDAAVEEGRCLKADTIDELLGMIEGMDVETAKASIERYNELARAGEDTDFFKSPQRLFALENGPFYAAECGCALTLGNLGGLESDEDCHVYNTDRELIPGLYAAGATQGGRFAVQYPISLKGLSCGMCMVYGKIAGENAAAGK